MKKRILFVDDEPEVLLSMRRMLRSMRSQWEIDFAGSGQDALRTMAGKPCDVVAADMRMPGMDGLRLLERVRELHPGVVRIILSDHSDKDAALKSVGLAHYFLSKPCEAGKLKITITHACGMRALLTDEPLINLISRIDSLPSLPSLYQEVVEEAQSQNGSLAKVGDIISKDVGMSAKLLQVVNSAFFGFPGQVSSIMRAVNLLGLENIKALILSLKIFTSSHPTNFHCYSLSSLWSHSISVGMIARSIATQEGFSQNLIDEAFMAGMLHDVGKVVLMDKLPEECLKISELVKSSGCQLWEAEQKISGTTHAQLGAYLMGMWGLSESVVEAIAFHHCPGKSTNESFGTLTVIHLANSMEHRGRNAKKNNRLDVDYLKKLGISDRR
ncbi:MAG: response regulator [Deltaproteobacteria bacterium]|jgi:HD-like signal output (HDOD) protein|nr:response regulator [Deltaproteobacteria bacterium]